MLHRIKLGFTFHRLLACEFPQRINKVLFLSIIVQHYVFAVYVSCEVGL